jgi:hypothetical protein
MAALAREDTGYAVPNKAFRQRYAAGAIGINQVTRGYAHFVATLPPTAVMKIVRLTAVNRFEPAVAAP